MEVSPCQFCSFKLRLQRVVVGKRAGLNLVDVSVGVGSTCKTLLAISNRRAIAAAINATRDVVELVEVDEVEQVAPLRTHIANLNRNPFGQLRLNVQVVGDIPGRNQILRNRERAARAVRSVDRLARDDPCDRLAINCCRGRGRKPDIVERRSGLAGKVFQGWLPTKKSCDAPS